MPDKEYSRDKLFRKDFRLRRVVGELLARGKRNGYKKLPTSEEYENVLAKSDNNADNSAMVSRCGDGIHKHM